MPACSNPALSGTIGDARSGDPPGSVFPDEGEEDEQNQRPEGIDACLPRLMGCSTAMIDRHYGHVARGSDDAIRARLEARPGRSGVEVASRHGRRVT